MAITAKDAEEMASEKPFVNKNVKKPLSGEKEITKIIAVSSDKVLPADAAQAAYASGHPVTLKETCYGLVLTGTEENVNAVVKIVRDMDKNHIFVKDRGFPAGDPRRCRATRNGGQRPGFYTLHEEISKMGTIGEALDDYEAGIEKTNADWPNQPSSFKIEDYIDIELGKNKKKPQMAKVIADKIEAKKKAAKAAEKDVGKSAAKTADKTAAKKAVSKTEEKKSTVKKSTAEKQAAKKSSANKSTAKAPVAKKTVAKTGKPAAKTNEKKSSAKKK